VLLVELGMAEQAGSDGGQVLGGASVTEVAGRKRGRSQDGHDWLRRYAGGLAGLANRSSRPVSCPHRMGASGVGSVADRVVPGAGRGGPGAVEVGEASLCGDAVGNTGGDVGCDRRSRCH
jgi:hypothetical protein